MLIIPRQEQSRNGVASHRRRENVVRRRWVLGKVKDQFVGLMESIKAFSLDYRDTKCPGRNPDWMKRIERILMTRKKKKKRERESLARSGKSVKIIRVGAPSVVTPTATRERER